ncbi:hypothetical protein [Arenibacterium halophilum]|uniref:HTH cro/C1-type domain-containing protein n=1 Tax=Arenibacterium halophilum TaxID=2583821 RepID=A0ABY2X7Z5_9RHOB|nr:hypothetical protein [Arenibacterium halophilum]TMV11920.1 hypothetical protein FGK64_16845 [Arenibacterium halophilum]
MAFAKYSQAAFAKYILAIRSGSFVFMTEPQDKSAFVQRLEGEMERAGIENRKELERASGIAYHRLNPWFVRPAAKPNAADLLTLARLFNVSEEYLLDGGPRRPFQRMAALLARAEALDEAAQADLESYVDFLEQRYSARQSDRERE